MNFLNDFKNSFYNPEFYSALRGRPISSSFRYYFSLIGLLSLFIAFVLGVQFSPAFSEQNLKKLANYYPEELSIAIKGGVVSTNVTEPYFIKAGSEAAEKNKRANFAVVDTAHPFSLELFREYDASVWLGKNFAVSEKNRSQYEISDLSRAPNFSLDKQKILRWVQVIGSYRVLITLAVFVFLFLGFLLFFAAKLILFLIFGLLVMLIAKVKKISLSFGRSYQVALHAATAAVILEALFIIFSVRPPFPFLLSLILLITAFVNLKKNDDMFPQAPVA